MLGLPKADMALLADKPDTARIHVLPMGLQLQPEALSKKIERSRRWTHVVAFRPTGVLRPSVHMRCGLQVAVQMGLIEHLHTTQMQFGSCCCPEERGCPLQHVHFLSTATPQRAATPHRTGSWVLRQPGAV